MLTALSRFAPPLALMALTFFLSAQPDLNSGLGDWDTVLRKGAHMIEFGLLWLLWWRALGYGHPGPAIAIALAYAATDEWHQTFVARRHGSPLDWAIDAAGVGLAGLAVVWVIRSGRWTPRRPRRPAGGNDRETTTAASPAPARR